MKNVDTIKILIVHYVAWLADTTLNNRISFTLIRSWTNLIHFDFTYIENNTNELEMLVGIQNDLNININLTKF